MRYAVQELDKAEMEEARRRRQQFEEDDTELCAPGSAVGKCAEPCQALLTRGACFHVVRDRRLWPVCWVP